MDDLERLEARRAELERELTDVRQAIDRIKHPADLSEPPKMFHHILWAARIETREPFSSQEDVRARIRRMWTDKETAKKIAALGRNFFLGRVNLGKRTLNDVDQWLESFDLTWSTG